MDDELAIPNGSSQESDIIFTRSVKAGRRIYYLDVKENNKGELFLAITESKRITNNEDNICSQFEKHKIFLYPKDFERFMYSMSEAMNFITQSASLKSDLGE